MKYVVTVSIDKPINKVMEILQSREHALKWIKGLTSFDLIEGNLGEVNSKYKMVFEHKGKTSQMIETLQDIQDQSITTIYEQNGVWNECINQLEDHGEHTHYKVLTTFKFPWYMTWFIWAFKSSFIKESLIGINDFKHYVEAL